MTYTLRPQDRLLLDEAPIVFIQDLNSGDFRNGPLQQEITCLRGISVSLAQRLYEYVDHLEDLMAELWVQDLVQKKFVLDREVSKM